MINKYILDYLRYLRDVSRKIGSNLGFEKVFVETRGRKSSNIILAMELKSEYQFDDIPDLLPVLKFLENNPDKKLFMGVGALYWRETVKSKPSVAGPLLILQCEIDWENRLVYLPNDAIVLNYDLISKVLEKKSIYSEDKDIYYQESQVINDVEEMLSKLEDVKNLNRLVDVICAQLKTLKEFSSLQVVNQSEYDILLSKSKDGLYFVNKNHFFVAGIPNEISTYNALQKLIEEVENQKDFKNETLSKLLAVAFSGDNINIKHINYDNVDNVVDLFIPMSLSSTQRRAVRNAFSHEISYTQGPPGTGKSHTISAIVLASTLLGKRVLVVSQKSPAVEVVKNKVYNYLKRGDIMPIIYFHKGIKQELKDNITKLLSIHPSDLKEQVLELENEINNVENSIRQHYEEMQKWRKQLKTNIENEELYARKNEEFQEFKRKLEEFHENNLRVKSYDYKISYGFLEKLKRVNEAIERMENNKETKATLLFKVKLIRGIKSKFNYAVNGSYLVECLKERTLSILLKDLVETLERLLELKDCESKLGQDNNKIRTKIEHIKEDITEKQEKYLKLKNQHRILSKLLQEEYRDELEKFKNLLRYKNPRIISDKQEKIDWYKVLELFPVWISEIRYLNEILPMQANMFDLVVVDEASQVNLAEIMPVFYRGRNICIVGDHNQLSLVATGLTFDLSKRLDRLTWEKYKPKNLTYESAEKRNLTVDGSSILDFIRSEENAFHIPETMLDEHFRSLPALARFTNENFYEGKLRIMTETPDKVAVNCFYPVRVNGKRRSDNTIKEEAIEVIEIIKSLVKERRYRDVKLHDFVPDRFSIGVISMIRNQVELIKELLGDLPQEVVNEHQIIVGTPEELQGHERDVMIFSLCVDENSIRSANHYQNPNRLNVATSRAKHFVFFVYSEIPSSFNRFIRYFRNFGYDPEDISIQKVTAEEVLGWKLDESKFDSEFEKLVYHYLREYIKERSIIADIKIYNQVRACGQKRLDFVLYNTSNKIFVAVEVDGIHHFDSDGKTYSQDHLDRADILKRAGWKIIHTPYYKWYRGGWLRDQEEITQEVERIYRELDNALGISPTCLSIKTLPEYIKL